MEGAKGTWERLLRYQRIPTIVPTSLSYLDAQPEVVRDRRQARREVLAIVGVVEDLAPLDATGDYVVHCI